jgi:chromosome segregation ATPase
LFCGRCNTSKPAEAQQGDRDMSKRDDVIREIKAQLDEVNAHLDELENKAKSGQQKLGQKYDEQVAQLKASSRAAKKKLDDIRAAGEDKWEAVAMDAEKLKKALVHSFNYFKSQLK